MFFPLSRNHATPDDQAGSVKSSLFVVTPPRVAEASLSSVEHTLDALPVGEAFSLELAGDADGVRLMARGSSASLRRTLAAQYPQATLTDVADPYDDPMALAGGERAFTQTLRIDGPEYLPLRHSTADTATLGDLAADPFASLISAFSGLGSGERLVSRLILTPRNHDWSAVYREMAMSGPGSANQRAAQQERDESVGGGFDPALLILLPIAGIGVQGWLWYNAGEMLKVYALAGGSLLLGAGGLAAYLKFSGRKEDHYDPALVSERVGRIAFDAEVRVTAILGPGESTERARELLRGAVAAYRNYDNPLGAQFATDKIVQGRPDPGALLESTVNVAKSTLKSFFFGLPSPSVLGAREIAALWHPPAHEDEVHPVTRAGSKQLPAPPAEAFAGGAVVGEATAGETRSVAFADDTMRRHHLYVARTRMGKSTLMQHVVSHRLRQKAEGRHDDAIVVIDPHADLVTALLELVPPDLADRVWLIDLGDDERVPGINLLDAGVFEDRDWTTDGVIRVAQGLWDQWGPRMQSILEHTVKSLHEANNHPSVRPEDQYTLLDGMRMLADEDFRHEALTKVRDPFLLRYWARDFGSWNRQYRNEAIAPVQTRLSYYASSKKARAILGQSRSTLDVGRIIRDGDVLLVSTAQGSVGRDVAALVGASILNLIDAVIRQQGTLTIDERRGAMVVVDEMQTIPGVDYPGMLSELGKFGGNLVLATQSLSKLDELSDTMRDTILANTGCLVTFQVNAVDAQRLAWELGREQIEEDDITSLPVHHAYVRAIADGQRWPTYSMRLAPPPEGDPETAGRIRERAADYTSSAAQVASMIEERVESDIEGYRAGLKASANLHVTTDAIREAIDLEKEQNPELAERASASDTRPLNYYSEGHPPPYAESQARKRGRSSRGGRRR